MGLCLEVRFISLEDILHISLWVQVDKWEPRALYLNLQFVSFFNGMDLGYKLTYNFELYSKRVNKGLICVKLVLAVA